MTEANTREDVVALVYLVKEGDNEAFKKLEGVAKPLLTSIATRFSNYHHRFEFDDFYSLSLYAMYKACLLYDGNNPSFLNYAKIFMLNRCYKEVEYWNQGVRNIFNNTEIEYSNLIEVSSPDDLFEDVLRGEFREQIEGIISSDFKGRKALILRMHILDDIKVCDISKELGLNYKNVHSVITRGTDRIIERYTELYVCP